MINITVGTDNYKYDEDTGNVFKNNEMIPSGQIEPVYYGDDPPQFAGLYFVGSNKMVSVGGNINFIDNSL